MEELAWYLVQLKPNCQRIAERNLARQGFRTFLPRYERTRRGRGRFTTTLAPLFPGYLFIQMAPAQGGWRAVNSTLGVSRIVSFGSSPTKVPTALILGLIARTDETATLSLHGEMQPGDTVQILSGPFAEFVAQVQEIDPERRVWVLLDLMGRAVRTAFDGGELRSIATRS